MFSLAREARAQKHAIDRSIACLVLPTLYPLEKKIKKTRCITPVYYQLSHSYNEEHN